MHRAASVYPPQTRGTSAHLLCVGGFTQKSLQRQECDAAAELQDESTEEKFREKLEQQ